MRLFVAISPPPAVLAELRELQKTLLEGRLALPGESVTWDKKEGSLHMPAAGWRPASADQLHLTLQFLGDENTAHQKEEIRKALEGVGPKHELFVITASHLGAFPNEERARVVWAAVESENLQRLADDIAQTLSLLGIARDKPFVAHITLARSKFPQDAKAMLAPHAHKPWSTSGWRAEEFVLYESTPVLQGREHVAVERYRLQK